MCVCVCVCVHCMPSCTVFTIFHKFYVTPAGIIFSCLFLTRKRDVFKKKNYTDMSTSYAKLPVASLP